MSEYECFQREIREKERREADRWSDYCRMREEEERMKLLPVYLIVLPGLVGSVFYFLLFG